MRIRRRPQPSFSPSPSPSPSFLQQQPSDPSTSTAPQTPGNAAAATNQERLEGGGGGGEDGKPHLHASADLGQKSAVARRLALPQEDNAGGSVERQGAERGADEFQRSLQANGHRGADRKDDVTWTGGISGGERAAKGREGGLPVRNNGTTVAVMLALKDEKNGGGAGAGASVGGGAKKRRGPAVLMEGSRCSRVNGRGWRCSQPTLVGYSLCEHHLGKGRTRSASSTATGGGGRGGVGQLGRTEHRAAMPVVAVTATTKAEEPDLRRY